jgi:Mn-containing catalase
MPAEKLIAIVDSLSPEEQAAVREFIEFLRQRAPQHDSAFRSAVDEFMDQHPELLRRLAQ